MKRRLEEMQLPLPDGADISRMLTCFYDPAQSQEGEQSHDCRVHGYLRVYWSWLFLGTLQVSA